MSNDNNDDGEKEKKASDFRSKKLGAWVFWSWRAKEDEEELQVVFREPSARRAPSARASVAEDAGEEELQVVFREPSARRAPSARASVAEDAGGEHVPDVSETDMEKIREAFARCDHDESGTVCSKELGEAMRYYGMNPSKRDIAEAIASVDTDGDGVLNFEEFTKFMAPRVATWAAVDQMKALVDAFTVFDTDGSGYLSIDELKNVLTSMGEPLDDEEMQEVLADFDADGDGRIKIEEYVQQSYFPDMEPPDVFQSINGRSTTIIEVGEGGALLRKGDKGGLESVEQILLVLDPRAAANILDAGLSTHLKGIPRDIVTVFLLMPSTTSSPQSLVNVEVALQYLGCASQAQPDWDKVNIVRVDDYRLRGPALLKAMIEEGQRVYPAEEVESMLGLIREAPELNGSSRFDANIYNYRAWTHWAVGLGMEEGEIKSSQSQIASILGNGPAKPRDGPAPRDCDLSTFAIQKAVLGRGMAPTFIVFNDYVKQKVAELSNEAHLCTRELVQRCISSPDTIGRDILGGIFQGGAYPISILDPECIVALSQGFSGYSSVPIDFMSRFRETNPCTIFVTVIVDESYDKIANNKWLMPAIHNIVENADVCIFATYDELPAVLRFFTKVKFPAEHVGMNLGNSCVPFPRLHFFTMKTAMGQNLEEGSILVPAVTVGHTGSGLDNTLFRAYDKRAPFFLTDANWKPITDKVILAADDATEDATVIAPMKLLIKLVESLLMGVGGEAEGNEESNGDNLWVKVYGEAYAGGGSMELTEVVSNLSDLIAEMQQYLSADGTQEEEGE